MELYNSRVKTIILVESGGKINEHRITV
jgi:hypothetical protein